jgi:hypothetical protein
MSEKGAITTGGIDRYPDGDDIRPTRLALAGHPVLQSVRVRNHRLAEGIDGC